jgi:hypothetical protein
MKRIVEPELLDSLPPEDPRAVCSRRDLRRINWWMRNHAILAKALEANLSPNSKNFIELGAGDGHLLLAVAQKMSRHRPGVNVTLLDRQKNVSAETLASFASLGWRADAIVTDVFNWSPPADPGRVVIANLFLHHFEGARLAELLRNVSRSANLFVAVEPYRFGFPSFVGPLLGVIGCNDVTRHDAVVSIRAGFSGEELSALWPDKTKWQLTERRAGFFSHLFIARRLD